MKGIRLHIVLFDAQSHSLSLPSVLHKLDETSNPRELNYRLSILLKRRKMSTIEILET